MHRSSESADYCTSFSVIAKYQSMELIARYRSLCPRDTKWFSYMLKGPAVRYEISLSLESNDIVCVSGAFACDASPDMNIFRKSWIER